MACEPLAAWVGFIILILILLVIDLAIFHKKNHAITIKEALAWTGVWFGLSLLFNSGILYFQGGEQAVFFLTGYLIEKALSVDNLFVMLVIFTALKIAPKYQHKVLFWGITTAIILRGIVIGVGAALIAKFSWILYLLGAFTVYLGIKLLFKDEEDFDPHDSFIVKTTKKIFHVSHNKDTHHFFVKEGEKLGITLLFIALVVIEFTDVAFAFDSIPAIFAITTDPFIVFTSNIFAILGLRSLYFVIAKTHEIFHYLNIGLGVILIFIGFKLFAEHWVNVPTWLSLVIVMCILICSMAASILHKKKKDVVINLKN